jgi:hypothetical protein
MGMANVSINNPNICFVCGRRACGLAVGEPQHLGWYCDDCNSEVAKKAIVSRKFDVFEERACQAVAELAGTDITLTKAEMADFVRWAVTEFGNALRKELESNGTTS